jgi:hypothetical protein
MGDREMGLIVNWIHVAQDRVQLLSHVNTVFRISIEGG